MITGSPPSPNSNGLVGDGDAPAGIRCSLIRSQRSHVSAARCKAENLRLSRIDAPLCASSLWRSTARQSLQGVFSTSVVRAELELELAALLRVKYFAVK